MKKLFLVLFVAVATVQNYGQSQNLKNGLALQGYDAVAYFEDGKATEGSSAITAGYNGAVYYFSSEKNKMLFLKNPSRYIPQFGGYCAYGMSQGYKAPIKPEAFTIVDEKLYLNYNLEVKTMWMKEQQVRIAKANENWKKMESK